MSALKDRPTRSPEARRAAARAAERRWRAAHPEAAREAQLRYRAAHLEAVRAAQRQRYAANLEAARARVKESGRRWRAAHLNAARGKVNEASRRRYAANPEVVLAAQRRRRAADLETAREAGRRYRGAHQEAAREASRRWYAAHLGVARERFRRRRATNPEAVHKADSISQRRRRARKASVLATLTTDQWEAILATYKNRCVYCGKRTKMTQDHLLAASKRGPYTMWNILPCCQSCNSHKGVGPPPKPVQPLLI